MSLTSSELNYLVWRYLQESGHELAAYALDKASQCLTYEESPTSSASSVGPGCLVDLVQRGILYTMTEAKIPGNDVSSEMLSLLAVLELQKNEAAEIENGQSTQQNDTFRLRLEAQNGSYDEDTDMKDPTTVDNNEENNADSPKVEDSKPDTADGIPQATAIDLPFTTKHIKPVVSYPSSICSDWHPGSEAFAFGQESSLAVISAFKDGEITETVQLNHSSALNGNNEINIVSWSPNGNVLVTCGSLGDLRAWSPDGKLRNLAINTIDENGTGEATQNGDVKSLKLISSLIWNENGQYLITVDVNGEVCLRDGNNLNVIHHLTNTSSNGASIDACWLDDSKFSVSTSKNTIRIFGVTNAQSSIFGPPQLEVSPIGLLNGHEYNISIMKFNSASKLLASCSDYDYTIKIWSSNSSADPTILNHRNGTQSQETSLSLHNAPVVELKWLDARHLLSVSMDGIINIWDITTATALISSKIFTTAENFHFDEEDLLKFEATALEVLAFNASVTSDCKWLAIGDSLGRVSIWDVSLDHYFSVVENAALRNTIHCVGMYELEVPGLDKIAPSTVGVCDLRWDSTNTKLSSSYMGTSSLIFELTQET